MVNAEENAAELRNAIAVHAEWLLTHESGRAFPVNSSECDVFSDGSKLLFAFPDQAGFRTRRIVNSLFDNDEIVLAIAGPFGGEIEEIRLVPRVLHGTLAAAIEVVRLERANAAANAVRTRCPELKIGRIELKSGRIARITAFPPKGDSIVIMTDVSGAVRPETQLASALLWFEKASVRKKLSAREIWLIGSKRVMLELRRLHALLQSPNAAAFRFYEMCDNGTLDRLEPFAMNDLWKEKAAALRLPGESFPSSAAVRIQQLAPAEIDTICTANGETLRYNGLPFARVRTIGNVEMAWFGTQGPMRRLTDASWPELEDLLGRIAASRCASPRHRRHEYFRNAPEAWLESILRRDIKKLDPNLILSPLYHQFPTSADKIDLLAMRRDGRLVIIELKTSPDREMIFQAADYWRKIELQRRSGVLRQAKLFGDLEIRDQPALVYTVAPALSFHREHERFVQMLVPEIEIWRFGLHEHWRQKIRVVSRSDQRGQLSSPPGRTNL